MNCGDSPLVGQIHNSQNKVVSNKDPRMEALLDWFIDNWDVLTKDPNDKAAGKKSDPTAHAKSKQRKASRNHKSSKSQRKKP